MDTYALAILESKTAATMMSAPGGIAHTDTSVWEVIERFLTGPARHVVVVDAAGHYAGIIGTRHLAGLWPLDPKQLKSTPVQSLGCAAWIALRPETEASSYARCASSILPRSVSARAMMLSEFCRRFALSPLASRA